MENIVHQLKKLGFNEYEAKCYVSLVIIGTATAYQVSKDSGIPRSRIYEVLNNLVEKGIVIKEEIKDDSKDSAQYSPLPVEILLKKAQTEWSTNFEVISNSLREIENTENKPNNRVMTLKDRETILTYCKVLLKKAKRRVIISMWDDIYDELEDELHEAASRVSVQGITLHVANPPEHVDRHRITPFTETPTSEHWFIISIDAKEMIYGPSFKERSVAFYTDDPLHIYLLEDYVWHDVLVNRLVRHSEDDDLQQWITSERKAFFME